MATMTGGEALVAALYREGVRVVFGLPGVQLYGVIAALRDEPRIRFIGTRHEQATTYMADGYARSGGGVGTALVVPGPGLLNAAAGLYTAYSASSPVLVISGQIPRGQIGKDLGVLHEISDQQACIAPITKWRKQVLEVADVPAAVRDAFEQLRSGRPRPVEIEMPPETMESEGEVELLPPVEIVRQAAPAADLDRAAEILIGAQRPLIYAGGGVHISGAHDALLSVAEYLQAAVTCTAEAKGSISDRNDLSLGLGVGAPVRAAIQAADVVLVVGSRLAMVSFAPGTRIIQIDIDPDVIGRTHKQAFRLVGDARATLEGLLERVRAGGPARASRKAEREALRAEIKAQLTQEPQRSILSSLRAACPDDTIVISGMTQVGYYSRALWETYHPHTYISPSYSGNLGYEYAVALGAKVAHPDKPVVALIGDGGFLFNAQEMATAVQYGINAVAVVFNDNAYGNVARDLDEDWGGQFASTLHNPDFMKLADAFGVHGMRATEPSQVGRVVADAIAMDRPVLVEVPVGSMERPRFFPQGKGPAKYRR